MPVRMKPDHVKRDSPNPVGSKAKGVTSGSAKPSSGPAHDVEGAPAQGSRAVADSDHEEWLLDESLVETFPASDPIAPALPPEDQVPGVARQSGSS